MHENDMNMGCKCEGDCHCKGDMKHMWRMHRAVRMLTAVVVIIFIFWCGFQFGEIRAMFGSERGYTMMRYGTGNMMQQYEYGNTREVTPPSATVTNSSGSVNFQGPSSVTVPNVQ